MTVDLRINEGGKYRCDVIDLHFVFEYFLFCEVLMEIRGELLVRESKKSIEHVFEKQTNNEESQMICT